MNRAIVVATGARPINPPIAGLSDIPYWTNREALEVKEVPSSLVVLGGGAIGVELGRPRRRRGSRHAFPRGCRPVSPSSAYAR